LLHSAFKVWMLEIWYTDTRIMVRHRSAEYLGNSSGVSYFSGGK